MTVVLCDDHPLFLDTLADALSVAGHEVGATVSDPDDLVEAVARMQPELCLVDVVFGGVPRLDAAIKLRERSPETIVVLLTAANDRSMWDALAAGRIQGIVAKHCGLRELERIIRSALTGGRAVAGVVPPQRSGGNAPRLTDRERDILLLLDEGCSTREIAQRLIISHHTVRFHVQALLRKLQARDRLDAVRRARDLRLLDDVRTVIPEQRTPVGTPVGGPVGAGTSGWV